MIDKGSSIQVVNSFKKLAKRIWLLFLPKYALLQAIHATTAYWLRLMQDHIPSIRSIGRDDFVCAELAGSDRLQKAGDAVKNWMR